MRLNKLCLTLGLALVASAPGAQAADWNNGGSIKDRGGVPIPAPIPIVETFKWYLRADVGGGLITGGDPSAKGEIYGLDRDPLEGPAFGTRSSWFTGDFDTFAVGGVGAGAYLNSYLRADVTVDTRTKSDANVDGTYTYRGSPAVYDPGNNGTTVRIDGRTKEQTDVRGTVALANLYWDLTERGTRFVPYIGAGVGFAVRSLDRRHDTSETITDTTDPAGHFQTGTRTFRGQAKAHQLAPAASATAGFAYTLDQGMVLDFGYRYTYLGPVDFNTNINYSPAINGAGNTSSSSRLTIGDTHEHTLRAGVRWNVW